MADDEYGVAPFYYIATKVTGEALMPYSFRLWMEKHEEEYKQQTGKDWKENPRAEFIEWMCEKYGAKRKNISDTGDELSGNDTEEPEPDEETADGRSDEDGE